MTDSQQTELQQKEIKEMLEAIIRKQYQDILSINAGTVERMKVQNEAIATLSNLIKDHRPLFMKSPF